MSRFASSHVCTVPTTYRDRVLGRPQDPFFEPSGVPLGPGAMLFTTGGGMLFTNDNGSMEYS